MNRNLMGMVLVVGSLGLVVSLAGCREGTTGRNNIAPVNSNSNPSPTPSPNNPQAFPGDPVPGSEASVGFQARFTSGSTSSVVFAAQFTQNAAPTAQFWRATFTYNDNNGNRVSTSVDLDSTIVNSPSTTTAKTINVANPDIMVDFNVLNGSPTPSTAAQTLGATVIDDFSLSPVTANEGFTVGFDDPSTP